jgi:mRNA interferase HigB
MSRHPVAAASLKSWATIAKSAQWRNPADVQRSIAHADHVKVPNGRTATIFDIGRQCRLITRIKYGPQLIYVKLFLTHAEYDKKKWMDVI